VTNTDSRPLEGIKVADFGQFIAGPAVAMLLTELGASVIKVEPPEGDAVRGAGTFGAAMLRTHNRSKRSLAVDLRNPEGLAVAQRLVADSDVLIQNMRPGTMHRLGLGPEQAHALNPRIVYLSITAFGRDAPPSRAGLDIAVQAESGIMSVTGERDGDPQRVGFTTVDAAASYAAVQAVLAALFRRERTGEGAIIDTSLLETALHLQAPHWVDYLTSGEEPMRCGNGQPSAAPAAELVSVKDGHIVVSAYTPAHWVRLCATIGRPELATDPRFVDNDARLAHRSQLREMLSQALSDLTLQESIDMLSAAGIVAGAVRTYSQVLYSDDVKRLDMFPETLPGATDTYRYVAPPYSFRGVERLATYPAPETGGHSREVLHDLGYSTTVIQHLLATGAVTVPPEQSQDSKRITPTG